jgi:hypothetical protein
MMPALKVFYKRLRDPGMYEHGQQQGAAIAQRQQTLQDASQRFAAIATDRLFISHDRAKGGPMNFINDMVGEPPATPYEWYLQGWLRCCNCSAEQRIGLHRVWGNRVTAVLHLLHQHAATSATPEGSGSCCIFM